MNLEILKRELDKFLQGFMASKVSKEASTISSKLNHAIGIQRNNQKKA